MGLRVEPPVNISMRAEAGICVDAIRHFAGKKPILGVCLGMQLMTRSSEEGQRAFARAYDRHPFIFVPKVHSRLSRRRVLVSDYVEGRGFEEMKQREMQGAGARVHGHRIGRAERAVRRADTQGGAGRLCRDLAGFGARLRDLLDADAG